MFNSPLPRLPIIMLPLSLILLRLVTRKPRDSTANSAAHTVANALAEIGQLTLSLLALALLVLANALPLQAIGAEEVTECLFAGADCLVPAAGGAVGVVFCDTA
jgi:hypothetical protein